MFPVLFKDYAIEYSSGTLRTSVRLTVKKINVGNVISEPRYNY